MPVLQGIRLYTTSALHSYYTRQLRHLIIENSWIVVRKDPALLMTLERPWTVFCYAIHVDYIQYFFAVRAHFLF